MILTVPYSHRDLHQAVRLLLWVQWLSEQNGNSMKKERVLLVPSRLVSQRSDHFRICEIAARTFGEARCFVPETEYEHGWPGSCNFMLKEALEHIEKNFPDDMFLLEPDAIPLCPKWYEWIKEEWEFGSVEPWFMGNQVHYAGHPPHMTGIGVYGKDWRKVAPKLAVVQDAKGWDTYAADQILPHAHITDLIQHIWWKPTVSLELINDHAVVFHQDKAGKLIQLLDEFHFNGEADLRFGYSKVGKATIIQPMKYFLTYNANRKIKTPEFEFVFEKTQLIGGAWQGIWATENEAEIASLLSIVGNKATGVKEITAAEYAGLAKKKLIPQPSSVVTAKAPPVQINQSPAVLVENPEPSVDKPESGKPVESIDEVLKIGTVVPTDGPKLGKVKKGKKK